MLKLLLHWLNGGLNFREIERLSSNPLENIYHIFTGGFKMSCGIITTWYKYLYVYIYVYMSMRVAY